MATGDSKGIINIELIKGATGLGFNIVGGTDCQHIPGDSGIFITKIRSDTNAANHPKLNPGDRVLAVGDTVLIDVTHAQAVETFQKVKGIVKLKIEPQAEKVAQKRFFANQRSSSPTSISSQQTAETRTSSQTIEHASDSGLDDEANVAIRQFSQQSMPNGIHHGFSNNVTQNAQSRYNDNTMKSVPSAHNYQSFYTQNWFYTTVGFLALGLAGVLTYRRFTHN